MKHGFRSWVCDRIETQHRLTVAAVVGMMVLGIGSFIIQAGLIYLVLANTWGRTTGFVTVIAAFGVPGLYTWKLARKELRDRQHNALCKGRMVPLNVVLPISLVWSWAFGSMGPERNWVQKIIKIAMIPLRLCCAAWHTWRRVKDVRNIDGDTTFVIMKVLFRNDHSVTAESIADELGDVDLNKALRDVSLLDGIVFLTEHGVSLSVAPRLSSDFDARHAVGLEKRDSDDLFGQ